MWDTLWCGGHLATMALPDEMDISVSKQKRNEAGLGIIKHGAIAVKDGLITWVGQENDLPSAPNSLAKKVIPLDGAWLTPGLVDCHTHLVYGGNRADEFEARLSGQSYENISKAGGGIQRTARLTEEASEETLFQSASHRLQNFLQEGVTTIEIKSGYALTIEGELKMLRTAKKLGEHHAVDVEATFLGLHACPKDFEGGREAYVDRAIAALDRIREEELATAVDGFLETIAFNQAEIERFLTSAQEKGFKLHLHAEQLSDQNGASLAAKLGALSADHLEYITSKNAKAMAEADTTAVLLPGAYYYLGGGRKPAISQLRWYGVPMAIATDSNPGSSPLQSPLAAMNMSAVLFGLTPTEALVGMTRNGAKALGLGHDRGQLKTGYRADMAIWQIDHPRDLVYSLGASPLKSRIYQGQSGGLS